MQLKDYPALGGLELLARLSLFKVVAFKQIYQTQRMKGSLIFTFFSDFFFTDSKELCFFVL